VRATLLYFWLACHAALDAASSLPARSRSGEGRALFFWIPVFTGNPGFQLSRE